MVEARSGFETFARSNREPLLRAAWLLLGDAGEAEDLVQDTLSRTWRAWDRVSQAHCPQAYVRRIMTNLYLARRRRPKVEQVFVPDVPDVPAGEASDVVARRAALTTILSKLPKRQRLVIVLRYFDDLSVSETAKVLDCSEGNIKSQCSRALSKLRSCPEIDLVVEGVHYE